MAFHTKNTTCLFKILIIIDIQRPFSIDVVILVYLGWANFDVMPTPSLGTASESPDPWDTVQSPAAEMFSTDPWDIAKEPAPWAVDKVDLAPDEGWADFSSFVTVKPNQE